MDKPLSDLQPLAHAIRVLTVDAVEQAQSGHPGAPMGMADFATVLFARHLRFVAHDPHWFDRDRFILSNGHASMMLYALLYLTGSPQMTLDQIKNFRRFGSLTPGHPEFGHTDGVETTTGPLGQGLASAVGMAMAEQRLRDEFGSDVCDHRTFVCAGEGCLMEGVGQEALSLAGHLKLDRLTVLFDCNRVTIDGPSDLSFTEDTLAKVRSLGWHTIEADGHNLEDIDRAFELARSHVGAPVLIQFNTVIGLGAPTKQGTSSVHSSPLGLEEVAAVHRFCAMGSVPFEIPSDILDRWSQIGRKGDPQRQAWKEAVEALPPEVRQEWDRRLAGRVSPFTHNQLAQLRQSARQSPPKVATRQASHKVLQAITPLMPELIGGSADLSPSNLTRTDATDSAFVPGRSGRYVNWGVREFAMCAAAGGMAVHGGVFPYVGTFLVFTDYARNAIRLAAMMKQRVVYVCTHDSIGVGEDGPTHQPVEHLAALRAIPGLAVLRPADEVETIDAWEFALTHQGPTLLALSRQSVRSVHTATSATALRRDNVVQQGAVIVVEPERVRDITILATGSEVGIAVQASEQLMTEGIRAAVVSMPCWSLFESQAEGDRRVVLGDAPRIAVEAASSFGWTRYLDRESDMVSVNDFGASADPATMYDRLGINADAVVAKVKERLHRELKP